MDDTGAVDQPRSERLLQSAQFADGSAGSGMTYTPTVQGGGSAEASSGGAGDGS